MSCSLSDDKLTELRAFIELCEKNPEILHYPSLSFLKSYIESFGGVIPPPPTQSEPNINKPKPQPKAKVDEPMEEDESEDEPEEKLELDMEGVIDADEVDDSQKMGNPEKESTEEEIDQSDEKRSAAMKCFSEQQFEEAVKLYTEAIELNPTSALLYSKRGQTYLKLNKPNACIKDCTRALELNCDSAPSYKFRGRAYRLLGQFEKAASDLRESCKIDFDEQAQDWLKEVTPNADKIRAYNLNAQRRKEEKDRKEKMKQYQRAKAAHESAAKEQAEAKANSGNGFGSADTFAKVFSDPEMANAFTDPEVAEALQDAMSNPSNIFKYMKNPKIMNIINKLSSKVGTGGFPGFQAPPGEEPKSNPTAPTDNMGLD